MQLRKYLIIGLVKIKLINKRIVTISIFAISSPIGGTIDFIYPSLFITSEMIKNK